MKLVIGGILGMIYLVGALEYSDDKGDFAQVMRGIITMALSAVALIALAGMD